MKKRCFEMLLVSILISFFVNPILSIAKEAVQTWELINPEGVVRVEEIKIAPRISTLEGKTIVLRWNGKPNGELFLDRIAELLAEKVKNVKIVKAYETAPETSVISHGSEKAKEIAKKLLTFKPDIIIGSQAD